MPRIAPARQRDDVAHGATSSGWTGCCGLSIRAGDAGSVHGGGRCTAETPKRARIEFKGASLSDNLFSAGLGVIPAHVRDYATWRVSGGPFRLEAWHRGLDMIFVRNARASPAALLDRIRVVFVPDGDG